MTDIRDRETKDSEVGEGDSEVKILKGGSIQVKVRMTVPPLS